MYGVIAQFQGDYLKSVYMGKGIRKLSRNDYATKVVGIFDEADSLMLDKANQTLFISHQVEDMKLLADIKVEIWKQVSSVRA